jgi:hypothetical protein
MRFGLMTSAALTLGVAAFIPSTAKADGYRYDHDRHDRGRVEVVVVHHDEWRHESWHRDGDFVEDISVYDAPHDVRDRVNDYRHGRPIEYAQLVHHDGQTFYRFRIDDRNGDFYLHIAPSGHLLARIDVAR